ncbi:hypothetical protein A3Q56_04669 [Intoshia linei]|uniref:Uncharacterized protein n=1 Tax=Intoshia linei TaxID=1819745 RepID=A0A177B038_9BILA|nr:hypothetical protein A3Q56_04669 [Intoshia linei]
MLHPHITVEIKDNKDRITILLNCSADGKQIKPLFIEKSAKPRYFKGLNMNEQPFYCKNPCHNCLVEFARGQLLGESYIKRYMSPTIGIVLVGIVKWLLNEETHCCLKHTLIKYFGSTIIGSSLKSMFANKFSCVPEGQINTYALNGIYEVLSTLNPLANMDKSRYMEAANFSKSFSSNCTAVQKLEITLLSLLNCLVTAYKSSMEILPSEVSSWVKTVDDLQVLYKANKEFMFSRQ